MDEDAAVQAVVTTIDTNKAALVSGLTQNNQARAIEWLSDTLLAVPDAYYAISVHCEEPIEYGDPDVGNVNAATPYRTEYPITILAGEYATFEQDESVYGSTAHTNFRDLCKALVKLFRRDQKWFPSASASPRYRLKRDPVRGREVRVSNIRPLPVQDGNYLLGSEIHFTLVGCND